jgi:hypothetical protein
MKKKTIPIRYITNEQSFGTSGTRDKKTGRMTGRKAVSGRGDSTGVRRLKHDVDFNHDGKPEYVKGQIIGRTDPYPVRGSSKKRGSMRDI